jgi:hypothetical protein
MDENAGDVGILNSTILLRIAKLLYFDDTPQDHVLIRLHHRFPLWLMTAISFSGRVSWNQRGSHRSGSDDSSFSGQGVFG